MVRRDVAKRQLRGTVEKGGKRAVREGQLWGTVEESHREMWQKGY